MIIKDLLMCVVKPLSPWRSNSAAAVAALEIAIFVPFEENNTNGVTFPNLESICSTNDAHSEEKAVEEGKIHGSIVVNASKPFIASIFQTSTTPRPVEN